MKLLKQKFKIDGMHCSSCAMSIDMDLEDMEGVKESKTNYAKQVCEVEFDQEKLDVKDVISSIKNTGYKASISE